MLICLVFSYTVNDESLNGVAYIWQIGFQRSWQKKVWQIYCTSNSKQLKGNWLVNLSLANSFD